jgi:16S rRNA (uracil1498-N3)-methyltransferase
LFVFYSSDADLENGTLQEEELHHCVHVLRHKEGDNILVTNGKGLSAKVQIKKITRSILYFDVISSSFEAEDTIKNGIALSPPKSSDRLEWFIEKVTEIGIKNIFLFECSRTERSRVNLNRLNKIALSAMKQSKQCHMPVIKYFDKYADMLSACEDFNTKTIAFCEEKQQYLHTLIGSGTHITLIGPEGDFTIQEVHHAKEAGFTPVSLGRSILRTETAGLKAAILLENFKLV